MGNPYTEQQLDILAITNKRKCLKWRMEAAANQSIFTSSMPSTTRRKKITFWKNDVRKSYGKFPDQKWD
jgi:hypothetical protein